MLVVNVSGIELLRKIVVLNSKDGIGKGHEEYQEIGNTKHYFSEEKIVEEYLATK